MGVLDGFFSLPARIAAAVRARSLPPQPKRLNPKDKWFYSPAWRQAERDADDDLNDGRYEDFDTIDEVMGVLKQNIVSDPPDAIDRLAAALRRTVRVRRRGM